LEKRYNDFFNLNQSLVASGFRQLPALPHKTLLPVRNSRHLDKRKDDLASFIKGISARLDILNSPSLVRFLELDQRAPEVLARKPKLIEEFSCNEHPAEHFHVTHCKFLPDYNLFITCLNDSKK
jgi:hypothetical protein